MHTRDPKVRGTAFVVFRDLASSTSALRGLDGEGFFGKQLVSHELLSSGRTRPEGRERRIGSNTRRCGVLLVPGPLDEFRGRREQARDGRGIAQRGSRLQAVHSFERELTTPVSVSSSASPTQRESRMPQYRSTRAPKQSTPSRLGYARRRRRRQDSRK